MSRLFVPEGQIHGDMIQVRGDDARHLAVVLRRSTGDTVEAVGPDGTQYRAVITTIGSGEITARITGRSRPRREPLTRVTLAQALIKGDRWDWVLQKGTEVGVTRFVPFVSARTVVRPPADRVENRLRRWRRITAEAARQSGRLTVPCVEGIHDLPVLAAAVGSAAAAGAACILAREGERRRGLFDLLSHLAPDPAVDRRPRDVWLVVGPEGGFEQAEAHRLITAGAQAVTLGPLIFRADTAGPAMTVMVLYHLADLGRGLKDDAL